MRRIHLRTGLVLLALLVLPAAARAFSVDGYDFPSTPFMPPRGFWWVPVLFAGLFFGANSLLLRRFWTVPLGEAASKTLGIALGAVILTMFAVPLIYPFQIRDAHWNAPVFWGYTFAQIQAEFITVNGLSLLLVLACAACLAYHHPYREEPGLPPALTVSVLAVIILSMIFIVSTGSGILTLLALVLILAFAGGITAVRELRWRLLPLLGVNILVYLVCLLPYALTGAYAHGMPPWQECRHALSIDLGPALMRYTSAHGDRLPTGRGFAVVFTQLQPYTAYAEAGITPDPRTAHTMQYCAAGACLDRHPQTYRWNPAASGQTLAALRKLPTPIPLISCPYHRRFVITSADLLKGYDEKTDGILPIK